MNPDITQADMHLRDIGSRYQEALNDLQKVQIEYLRQHGWSVFSIFHGSHGHYVHSMKIAQRAGGGKFYVLETALSIARRAAQDKTRRKRKKN